jgi:hypothetical protein
MATLDESRAKMFRTSVVPNLAIAGGILERKNSLSVQAGEFR